MPLVDSETQICISLSERPGGFGNRFHNYLYGELGLKFIYRGGTTPDLEAAIAGLRALRVRGCGLSMPYKEQVLPLLDRLDPVAERIGAVNTIVNEDVAGKGRLVGYNTDYLAVRELLKGRGIGASSSVMILGSGGMARACAYAVHELGCRRVAIVARNAETGGALARAYGYEWLSSPDTVEPQAFDALVNATPVGMAPDPSDQVPIGDDWIRNARLVLDSVANPPETALIRKAKNLGVAAVSGFEVTVAQAAEQFRLYTGVTLRADQVARAAVFARGVPQKRP